MKNYFYKDDFLVKYMGKNVFGYTFDEFDKKTFLTDWKNFKQLQNDNKFFIYSKIDTMKIDAWHCLEDANFRLIDTNINFILKDKIQNYIKTGSDIKIRFAEKSDKKIVAKIAQKNFAYSRFHLDPLIDNKIANQIKYNWAQNYFFGDRGDFMIVATFNKSPIGFLQLINKKNDLLIDLIAVDETIQGKGVASSMIDFANTNLDFNNIIVGTQISNLASINLYKKLGFELFKSSYVFHYHS